MRTPVRLLLPAAIVVDDEPDERGNVMAMAIGAAEGAWDEQAVRLEVNTN